MSQSQANTLHPQVRGDVGAMEANPAAIVWMMYDAGGDPASWTSGQVPAWAAALRRRCDAELLVRPGDAERTRWRVYRGDRLTELVTRLDPARAATVWRDELAAQGVSS